MASLPALPPSPSLVLLLVLRNLSQTDLGRCQSAGANDAQGARLRIRVRRPPVGGESGRSEWQSMSKGGRGSAAATCCLVSPGPTPSQGERGIGRTEQAWSRETWLLGYFSRQAGGQAGRQAGRAGQVRFAAQRSSRVRKRERYGRRIALCSPHYRRCAACRFIPTSSIIAKQRRAAYDLLRGLFEGLMISGFCSFLLWLSRAAPRRDMRVRCVGLVLCRVRGCLSHPHDGLTARSRGPRIRARGAAWDGCFLCLEFQRMLFRRGDTRRTLADEMQCYRGACIWKRGVK
ncbi:hypothetical protein F4780DRAFT_726166 [Xylariomycetidae sp. FL0641]|nr:hypothetical protein F4780DRAFT_726166 [Xylariomycetidae sp. FL0641]